MSFSPLRREGGHAALYTLLLLPVALSLSAIAVDVSGWNSFRDALQQEADRIAFQAANALPDRLAAESYVEAAAAGITLDGANAAEILGSATSSSVTVRVRARYEPKLDVLGIARPEAYAVERESVAQLVPEDVVLIMADGGTLRPRLLSAGTGAGVFRFESWGSQVEWPSSQYFRCVSPPILTEENALSWDWWNDWNREDFRRWATQACFNPIFTPMKLAGIEIAEAILASRTNRLALVFTPGSSNGGARTARHIRGESAGPSAPAGEIGGFASESQPRSAWGGYLELERFLGDEVCFLLSDPVSAFSLRYHVDGIGEQSAECGPPLARPACGGLHRAEGHLSECYRSNSLAIREAIYWDAAKLPLPTFSAEPDVVASLKVAWTELLGLPDEATRAEELSVRGNLALSSKRRVILLVDRLPELEAGEPTLADILDAFQAQHIELMIVAFEHEGLSTSERAELRARAAAIDSWEPRSGGASRVRVEIADGPEDLRSRIAPHLAFERREIALRR